MTKGLRVSMTISSSKKPYLNTGSVRNALQTRLSQTYTLILAQQHASHFWPTLEQCTQDELPRKMVAKKNSKSLDYLYRGFIAVAFVSGRLL